MKPRKKRITAGTRTWYQCNGGPYMGAKILLGTPGTLPFTAKGMTGRYNQKMEWEESK